jgi:hypothetical protein
VKKVSDNLLEYANYLLCTVAGVSTDEENPFDPKVPKGVRKTLATLFQQLYIDGLALNALKEPHDTKRYLLETLDFQVKWERPWLLDLIAIEIKIPDFSSNQTMFENKNITLALEHLKQLYYNNHPHDWQDGELNFKKGLDIFQKLGEDEKQEFLSLAVYSGLALAHSKSSLENQEVKQKYDFFVETIEYSPTMSPDYSLFLVQMDACMGNFALAHTRLLNTLAVGLEYFLSEAPSIIWAPQLTHEWIENWDGLRKDASKLPWFQPRSINYWREVSIILQSLVLEKGA